MHLLGLPPVLGAVVSGRVDPGTCIRVCWNEKWPKLGELGCKSKKPGLNSKKTELLHIPIDALAVFLGPYHAK